MNILRLLPATVCLLTLSGPGAAWAHGPDQDPDVLIKRGLELRRAGKSEEALELFRRAHESAPCPRTLGQMGLVESSLQLWIEADSHLTAALATPDDAWVHKNRRFLEQAVVRAREHVGELMITGPPGAKIAVAGKSIGALPLPAPIRIAEGDVAVSASSDGAKPYAIDVSIKGGARAAISIVLEPIDLAAPRLAEQAQPFVASPSPKKTRLGLGASLAAGGLAALVWGVTWMAVDGQSSCAGCRTAYETRTPGLLLIGGGSALALAGGALIFWALHPSEPTTARVGVSSRSVQFEARF
ncbi:MAG TPA: tetratricopeptide repeat protein [Polyangia bacterium]|jgi:hypothetical protein